MRKFAGIDFETYSDVSLPDYGLYNYVNAPTFTPLMADIDTAEGTEHFDFILDEDDDSKFRFRIQQLLDDGYDLVAHNAGFERAVLHQMGIEFADSRVVDSAVYARMMGVGEKLEVASRQLSVTSKLEEGRELIRLFCIPNSHFNHQVPTRHLILAHFTEQWVMFGEYCGVDAKAGREIAEYAEKFFAFLNAPDLLRREDMLETLVYEQNQSGWHIDRPLIERMRDRAWANSIVEQKQFFLDSGSAINFNSTVQLKKYCAARGVKVKSLDKYQLPLVLDKVERWLEKAKAADNAQRAEALSEVVALLRCKQELGGSSLSKLQKMLDLAGPDDQLRDQYVHCGAGQTFRTAARGVQLQNLAKLKGGVKDMTTVFDYATPWSNTELADQLRQVFTATDPDGELVVGDFKSVESVGLGWLGDEHWKTEAYFQGLDVYKVLFTRFQGNEGMSVDDVTPEQRPRGKYSELSCGYQAGGKVVQDFMFRLGFDISLEDATQNVEDWRSANPSIVEFWDKLDKCLRAALESDRAQEFPIENGAVIRITPFRLKSIQAMHPGATSIALQIFLGDDPFVTRVVHGCYFAGTEKRKSVRYYKPKDHFTGGDLWSDVNETASQKASAELGKLVIVKLNMFGGKMAGIATQSLCREVFYDSMLELHQLLWLVSNARVMGQFHDELVVDWKPGKTSLEEVKALMEKAMSHSRLSGFPLSAEIKSAYRYIK